MNFPTAKSPPGVCLVSRLGTRTRECVYMLARVHLHTAQGCFQQKLRRNKDLFSELSQFQHLPVWVNLTRMISFVFPLLYDFFFPSQTQKFREKCVSFFKSAADKCTHAVRSQGASGTVATPRDRS